MKTNPWHFINAQQSVILSSLNSDQTPHTSYAPFVEHDQIFYVCISLMAQHTKNLLANNTISVMFIEDENKSANLFARKRVTFECHAAHIQRDCDAFAKAMALFYDKFGQQAAIYENMQDFRLFALTPMYGRAVFGFGQAYDFHERKFDTAAAGMGHLGNV